jgi:hypothetical protein
VRAILSLGCAHLDATAAQSSNSTPAQGSSASDEVVISAGRFDRRTLDHVTIPRFVQARAIASAKIDQLARWREEVCPTTQGLQPQDGLAVGGRAGSRLGAGLVSEFMNVLVVVDSTQVTQYSLNTIADYVGMLALTRTSLGGCNELPSIIDLLSPDCGSSGRAESITVADSAYLKALYSASLEQKLNISQGEIHDRMLQLIVGQ